MVLLTVMLYAVSALAAGRGTTPPSSPTTDPTVPTTVYRNETIRSNTLREINSQNNAYGYYDGVVPYRRNSLFHIPRYSREVPSRDYLPETSFMRRSSTLNYDYGELTHSDPFIMRNPSTATTRGFEPYFDGGYDNRTVHSIDRYQHAAAGRDQVLMDRYDRIRRSYDTYTDRTTRRPLSFDDNQLESYIKSHIEERTDIKQTFDTRDLDRKVVNETRKPPEAESDVESVLDLKPRPVEPDEPEKPETLEDIKKRQQAELLEDKQDTEPNPIDELLRPEPRNKDKQAEKQQLEQDIEDQQRQDDNKLKPEKLKPPEIPEVDHKKAEEIRGKHKTFDSYAQAKFDYYLQAGQEFLKQRDYYRAADAFTLADIFVPDDYRTYIGRAHALFGAGEYMSSSYYLQQAIILEPEKTTEMIEIIPIIGSRDFFDGRVLDLRNRVESYSIPELEFLLAYVHYNSNEIDKALALVKEAEKNMPEDKAVKLLKNAIDKKANASLWD